METTFKQSDYSYCKGTNCKKQKECKRWLNHYILEFIPKVIDYSVCINTRYSMFEEIKENK